jgi:hypothetical protein
MATRSNSILSARFGLASTVTGAALAALAGACAPALAGGGPENVLVIADPSSSESMYVTNYYKKARGIPDSNILYFDPDNANYAEFAGVPLEGFLGNLKQRVIDERIDFVVVTPGSSFFVNAANYVNDNCFPVNRFAISSNYTMAYIKDLILTGGGNLSSQTINQYYSLDLTKPLAFDSNTFWLGGAASTSPNARRYYIGALLGYTGANGNTLQEVLTMIDRSVQADGSRPGGAGGGTFYFMNNAPDPARNVRSVQFPTAINGINSNGGVGLQLNGEIPIGQFDVLGTVCGAATPGIKAANMNLLPGAFADHLTSFAATFDIAAQTKCSEWIAKGASGTAGTVEEPCNYQGKFPHSRTHVFYLQGMSLGEAWFRGHQYVPFQSLFLGDPITRTFTHIPTVSVPDLPGAPVSGTIQITPTGFTSKPGAAIAKYELLINGVKAGDALPGQKFIIDTTKLPEGFNELRVLAFDNSLTKNQGRWINSIVVDNSPVSTNLVKVTPSGPLTQVFKLTVNSFGGTPGEVRLLSNGRVVGTRQGDGDIFLFGMNLGAGEPELIAETFFTNGQVARSFPITLPISYSTTPLSGIKPIAFSYTKDVKVASPCVVELASTMDNDPATATYEILQAPAQSQVGFTTRGYRVLFPKVDACGTDTMTFRVTTASGVSNTATISIRYDKPCNSCFADCDGSGSLAIDDFICFQTNFALGDPVADCDASGGLSIDDFICFQTAFALGC